MLLFALAAARTAVAYRLHPAGLTLLSEIRLVKPLGRYGHTEEVFQLEVDRLALIAQTRSVRLTRLKLAALDSVHPAVLDKASARAAEHKGHDVALTLVSQTLDPLIVTGTRARIILSVAEHLLYLPVREVPFDTYLPYQRRAHDALVLERQIEQEWYTLVGALLVFGADIEKHIFPSIAPVIGQA